MFGLRPEHQQAEHVEGTLCLPRYQTEPEGTKKMGEATLKRLAGVAPGVRSLEVGLVASDWSDPARPGVATAHGMIAYSDAKALADVAAQAGLSRSDMAQAVGEALDGQFQIDDPDHDAEWKSALAERAVEIAEEEAAHA